MDSGLKKNEQRLYAEISVRMLCYHQFETSTLPRLVSLAYEPFDRASIKYSKS